MYNDNSSGSTEGEVMEEIGFIGLSKNYKHKEYVECVQEIYEAIKEEDSRKIFANRLLYSITNDGTYMKNIVLDTEIGKKLNQVLDEVEHIYVYGAGRRGRRLIDMFPEKRWVGYYDAKQEGAYKGIIISKLTENILQKDSKVVISNLAGCKEIKMQLEKCGYKEKDIITLRDYDDLMEKNIYFEEEILKNKINKEGWFVDVGAFDGKDTLNYVEFTGNEEGQAIVFEPDKNNYEKCKVNLKSLAKVEIHNSGLGSAEVEKVGFDGGKGEVCMVNKKSTDTIKLETLDNVVGNRIVSMIKMDIEGMELEALKGAAETIKAQAPALAISIYHKREDIWELPSYILQLNPNYNFYLRHYTVGFGDTVLYAIQEGVVV